MFVDFYVIEIFSIVYHKSTTTEKLFTENSHAIHLHPASSRQANTNEAGISTKLLAQDI